jgi:uncharacterized repeat protein (TIGR02543 family)
MELKNRILSIFAVFAFCVAATSAWAGQRTLESNGNGYYVNMPQSGTDTLTIGSGVGSFEIPGCGEACLGSVLVLIAPQGKHIQLIDGLENSPYDDGEYYRGNLIAFDGAYDNPIADDATLLVGSASYGDTLTIVSVGLSDVKTVAHIIDGTTSHKASVENRGNNCSGSVSSGNLNLNSVAVGTPVTLTVNPDEGCALSDAYVTVRAPDDTARVPMVGGSWFAGNELSFTMPYVDVYVVVNYVKETGMTAANGVSVVMPRKNSLSVTIPDGVKSFKVVQKKRVNNGVLVLTAPENMKLRILGYTDGEKSDEILKIYDGENTSASVIWSGRSGSVDDVQSSGNTMTLFVNGDYVISELTVELVSSNAGNAAVTYIDANGTEQELTPTQYTVLSSNIEPVNGLINLPGGWYVVNGNVAFSNPLLFDGETHIVLADGAEMRVNVWDDYFENSGYSDYGRNSAVVVKNRLAVYGQSLGSGSLIVESAGSGNYEYSVFAYDGIAINGGHVTIDGNITAGRWNDESFVVNGGIVNIHGVYAYDITLDWHKTTDTIVAENFYQPSSGSSTAITIADGKSFKDENGKVYRGAYEQFTLLSGKTLTPCYAVSVDLQDGSPVTDLAVTIGESFQRPDNPTRAGATFLGWYTSADGDTEFDFSAPITGNTVMYAKWEQDPVKYIDENGEEQSVSNYLVLSSGVNLPFEDDGTPYLPSGWYVVENSNTDPNSNGGVDLLIDGYINAHGDVHLILADGAEMKVNGDIGLYNGNLTIYGQAGGTGALNVGNRIYGYYDLTINGGRVMAENGIRAGIFSINGGYVKADKDTRTGIDCYNFVMNGGSISLGYVSASGCITLGWRTTTDYIITQGYYSGSGSRNTSIAEGKSFKDESGIVYTGPLSQAQNNAIGGKILTPYVELNCAGVQIFEDQNGRHAVFNGRYGGENETEAVNIPSGITVNSVQFTRSFPVDVYSTVVLPFSVNTAHVSGLKAVLYYNGIRVEDDKSSPNYGKSYIRMKVLWAEDGYIKDKNGKGVSYRHTNMSANTPYMLLMSEPTFTINAAAYPLTLAKTESAETTLNDWTFRGTWQYKKWGAKNVDPETGNAYGFSASESGSGDNKISVGDFVRVGEGAWIRPMRAYLVKAGINNTDGTAQQVRANGAYVKRPSVVQEELPELMSIVIDDEEGNGKQTTVIGQFNTRTGEFKMIPQNRTFDVKGRNVGKENKAHGAYYGKKAKK